MQDMRGDEISMIFQEPMTSLNPVFTVKRQITETLMRHMKLTKEEALEKAIDMLDLVGIPSPERESMIFPT